MPDSSPRTRAGRALWENPLDYPLGTGDSESPFLLAILAIEAEAAQDSRPLRKENGMDLLETAWGIIANAGEGDWTRESQEWQEAAARWRQEYHANLKANPPDDD